MKALKLIRREKPAQAQDMSASVPAMPHGVLDTMSELKSGFKGFEGGAVGRNCQVVQGPVSATGAATCDKREFHRSVRPAGLGVEQAVLAAVEEKLVQIGIEEQKRKRYETSMSYEQTLYIETPLKPKIGEPLQGLLLGLNVKEMHTAYAKTENHDKSRTPVAVEETYGYSKAESKLVQWFRNVVGHVSNDNMRGAI